MNKRTRMNTVIICSVLLVLLFSGLAQAQYGIANARSLGMGGAYTAVARGIEAPGWNPANLALSGRAFRLNLVSLGTRLHNNSFAQEHYNLYNGKYLTETDKQDILASIPDEGFRGKIDAEVQAMGLCIGNLAFTASGYAVTDFTMSKDIVDLALHGNEIGRSYDIGATAGEGLGISSFALSLGVPLKLPGFAEFGVGATAKYLYGFAYGNVVEASSSVVTDIDGLHTSGRLVVDNAFGGKGFGLDLGTAAALPMNWTIGLSVNNVVNSIKWDKDPERFTYTFRADSISVEKIASSDLDSVIVDSDESVAIDPFSSSIPAQMRLGIAHTGRFMTLAVDVAKGLQDGPGSSTKPRMSVGTELKLIPFLPLRYGFAVGGVRGFSSGVGFSIDLSIFSWDFAYVSDGGLFSGKGLGVAFNWMFRM